MYLDSLPLTFAATIPESYLDAMGHMNVMWYTHLFSQASGGLFQLIGMDREYFTTHQAGSFALNQFLSYRKEVRVGERVQLRTRLVARSERKYHVVHFMTKGEESILAATCEFLGAHIDMRLRRTSPFAPHIAANIDRLIAEHNQLAWQPPLCGVLHA